MKTDLAMFESYDIRRVYDEETETWWFSVVDIIQVLTQQPDYQTARKYWNKLKERLNKEGSQLVTNCHQLKMTAGDGKQREMSRSSRARGLALRFFVVDSIKSSSLALGEKESQHNRAVKIMMVKKNLLLSLIVAIAAGVANASTMKYTYDFTAGFDPGTPFNPITGSVSVVIDPALIPQTPTLVDSINLTIGSKTYLADDTYFEQWGSGLIFGSVAPLNSISGNTNDFMLILNKLLPSAGGRLTYSMDTSPLLYSTDGVALLLKTSEVPVPASLWLFGSGLFALSHFSRRRNKTA